MPADTKLVRVTRPFIGGMRDNPKADNESLSATDVLYPLEVACERGGWANVGHANVFGSNLAYTRAREVLLPGFTLPDFLVTRQGKVGVVTSGGRNGDATESGMLDADTLYRFGPVWQGEQLLLPEDGESPILTFAGNLNSLSGFGGTITCVAGSTRVVGVSTAFSSNWVGAYLHPLSTGVARQPKPFYRITSVDSTLALNIATTPIESNIIATASFEVVRFGRLMLHARVTDLGVVSTTATTAATGASTFWDTDPPAGSNRGRPGRFAGTDYSGVDMIRVDPRAPGFPGTPNACPPAAANDLRYITAVGSDTSITVGLAFDSTDTGEEYEIKRPMPGSVACAHKNRLYITGIPWYRRRLYISPPGWQMSDAQNGEFSYATQVDLAMMMAFQEITGPTDPGALNALASLPSGHLGIFSEVDVHIAWGEYPALSVERIAEYGCFGQDAVLSADEGAWFAGREGVFEFQGNRLRNIIEGHLDRSWADLMAEGVTACHLGMHKDHLFVFVKTASSNVTLVWSRKHRNWPSFFSLPTTITSLYSSRMPAQDDQLLGCFNDDQLADFSTTIVDHETTIPVTTNPGAFSATTPIDTLGPLSREREVKYLKTRYELVGTSSPVINVNPGPSGPGAIQALAAGTLESILEGYATPDTELTTPTAYPIGMRVNQWNVTYTRSGGTVTRLALHEIEALVKEYRIRG